MATRKGIRAGGKQNKRSSAATSREQGTVVTLFERYWEMFDGPELEREYRFRPSRLYRFDLAHVPSRVAVELEGGLYQHGWHTSVERYHSDCCKYSLAALDGWCVVRLTIKALEEEPGYWVPAIIKAIKERLPKGPAVGGS